MPTRREFLKIAPALPFALCPLRGIAADAIKLLLDYVSPAKYYEHPDYKENSGKVLVEVKNDTTMIDISQIDLARLSVVEKGGYRYNLPPVNFEEMVYRLATPKEVKVYSFGNNGVSEPIPNEDLDSRLVPGDIGFLADNVTSRGTFPFSADNTGTLILDKDKLDGKKEFYAIARYPIK